MTVTSRWFIKITMIILAIPAFVVFGGGAGVFRHMERASNGLAKILVGVLVLTKHVTFLTLGIWDPENLDVYQSLLLFLTHYSLIR